VDRQPPAKPLLCGTGAVPSDNASEDTKGLGPLPCDAVNTSNSSGSGSSLHVSPYSSGAPAHDDIALRPLSAVLRKGIRKC
jgi:hypothetical protein